MAACNEEEILVVQRPLRLERLIVLFATFSRQYLSDKDYLASIEKEPRLNYKNYILTPKKVLQISITKQSLEPETHSQP